MLGEEVTRIAGWDTHGLPVEIEVEKELKLNGKKEIESYGVAEFNARARQSVFRYQSEWEAALRPDRVLARLRAPLHHLQQRLHRDGLVAARAAAPAGPALPWPPRAAVLPPVRHGALEPRAGAGVRGGHHQLGLPDLPAGRRSVAPAAGLDHHAVDAALQRGGGGAPRARVRRVSGRGSADHPRDRAGRRCPAGRRRARPASPRSEPSGPSQAANWSGCATIVRSRWCRCPTIGRRGWSFRATFVTAEDGSRPGAHGAGFRRRRLPGRHRAPARAGPAGGGRRHLRRHRAGPRSRDGWSPPRRPTSSSSSGSSRTAGGTSPSRTPTPTRTAGAAPAR